MRKLDFEKAKSRFEQAKGNFIQLIPSIGDNELILWKELITAHYLGLEKDYKENKYGLAVYIGRLNASELVKQELSWAFTVFISAQWRDALELTPPTNCNVEQFESITAALKKAGYRIIQRSKDYCVINTEDQEGRFWFWEDKSQWMADYGWLDRLIKQALSKVETRLHSTKQSLLTTEQQEQPIKAAYVIDDITTNLIQYELTQEEVDELLLQFREGILSFIENRLSELPASHSVRSAGPVVPWGNDDSNVPEYSDPASELPQKNTDKKWWKFWKQ
jgi:hypothetical protein